MKKIILIGSIILALSFNSCRTPSNDRLEKDCSLKLPEKHKVIEDTFESEGPDFSLTYVVIIDKDNIHKVISQIEFNEKWIQSNETWTFNDTIDGVEVYATFDSKNGTLSYNQVLI